jgi:hypothetical protein
MRALALFLFAALIGTFYGETDWAKEIESVPWRWPKEDPNLFSSVLDVPINTPYEVALIRRPRASVLPERVDAHPFDVRILHDKEVLFEAPAEASTVFKLVGNRLYYAEFSGMTFGCKIIAFDLDSKKQLWKTDLKAVGPIGHSIYSNRVSLKLEEGVLNVQGWETKGKYIEYLDVTTGRTVAHRVFE